MEKCNLERERGLRGEGQVGGLRRRERKGDEVGEGDRTKRGQVGVAMGG